MSVKSDRWIIQMCRQSGMITPFEERLVREIDGRRIISAGVSSYGYDLRLAPDGFRVFSPIASAEIDPKNFDENSLIESPLRTSVDGSQYWLLPPHSYALGVTVETFNMPRRVIGICVGKCLPGNTRVVDSASGEIVELRTFVEEKREFIGTLTGQRIGAGRVDQHIHSGIKRTYEVTTGTGRVIRATERHPFLTFAASLVNEWTELRYLRPGDRIGVPRIIPHFGKKELPDHEADILGLLISDGHCNTPGHSPGYTSGDERLRAFFTEAVQKFGCLTSTQHAYGLRVVNRHGRGGVMTGHPNRMNQWLAEKGLTVRSTEKFVPDCIFTAPKHSIARFLRALFSGDGSVSRSQNGNVLVEYCSTSERLIRDVQHLLLRFGIIARLHRRIARCADYEGSAFILNISDKDAISNFGKEIGFVSGCQKDRRLGEILNDESLSEIGQSHILWDTIEAITPVGEEPVYDLSIAHTHNFIANDFIVHNSTYARSGLIVNTTPLEPGWRGRLVLEFSNSADLPIRIYANEGIAQVTFFESDEDCEVSYADRAGKYQDQPGLVTPKL